MSQSASEIEREVELSRANLEDTVEALKDKMSVGEMVNEAGRYLGDNGGAEMVQTLLAQARANPLPMALVGVGLVWLISGRGPPSMPSFHASRNRYGDEPGDDDDYERRTGFLSEDEYRRSFGAAVYSGASHPDYSRRSAGADARYRGDSNDSEGDSMMSKAGEMLSGVGGTLRRATHDARDSAADAAGGISGAVSGVAGAVSSAASTVGSAASYAGRTAYSAAETVADTTRTGADYAWRGGAGAYRGATWMGRGARRSFSEVLEAEPLLIGVLGLAAGAAIGALLPRTETEDRYLGETRDRLFDDAETMAREKYEQGKAVAEEAYRAVKEEAETHGLTTTGADSVLGKVSEAARATVDRVKESAAEKGLA